MPKIWHKSRTQKSLFFERLLCFFGKESEPEIDDTVEQWLLTMRDDGRQNTGALLSNKTDDPERTEERPVGKTALTLAEASDFLSGLQGLPEREMESEFDSKYRLGVRGKDQGLAFKHTIWTKERKPAVIDQNGRLRVFENEKELKYVKRLINAKAETPLIDTNEWTEPGDAENMRDECEQNKQRLAEKANVPAEKQKEWIAANTDKMTGLLNRNMYKYLEGWILDGKKVSIASFDADHFGALNKLRGTKYGDYLIEAMGAEFRKLEDNLQGEDNETHVGRMGGEEFVVISTVPQDILNGELDELNTRLMDRVEQSLKDRADATELLQNFLLEKKGISHETSEKQIGSCTTAVSEFEFSKVWEKDPNADPADVAREAVMSVDRLLEHAKDENSDLNRNRDPDKRFGRNSRVIDPYRDAISNAEGLMDPDRRGINEELDTQQNINIRNLSQKILAEKESARIKQMNDWKDLYLELQQKLDPRDFYHVCNLVESPDEPIKIPDHLVDQVPGLESKIETARADYMSWASRHEPNLNSLNTDTYLQVCEKRGYTREIVIDPAQFKCINEILGHSFGDRLLEWNLQNTIRFFKEEYSIEDLVVAKEFQKLRVAIPDNLPINEIKEKIEEYYTDSFDEQILSTIDSGSDSHVFDKLVKWLQGNKTQSEIDDEPLKTINVKEVSPITKLN